MENIIFMAAVSSSNSTSSSNSSSSSSSKSTKPKETKPQYTQSSLKVYVNVKKVDFANKLLQYEESNLLPLRDISKALGASFTYNVGSGTIGFGLTKDKYKVTLTLGSKTILYNGKSSIVSTAPKAINGITYIPVQAIKDLGASMKFTSSNNTLNIEI